MTVFIVQQHMRLSEATGQLEPAYDFSPAEEFGPLRFLLSPTAAPWHPERLLPELRAGLSRFCDADFLLAVGNPILIGLATTVACDANGGRVQFLQWSGRNRRYHPVSAQVFGVPPAPLRG